MPNHVENRIEFNGDAQQISIMLNEIKSDKYGVGTIDFNKIVPMPESLNIEAGSKTDRGLKAYRDFIGVSTSGRSAEEAQKALEGIPIESENAFLRQRADIKRDEWELGKIAWQNIYQYGAPTWYEWAIGHWGTKWNAYGYKSGTDYSQSDALSFQTAWSGPHPLLRRLSEMFPDISFRHRWADEDIGANCGERCYLGGEITDEFIPEGIRATDFALELWDLSPLEIGMAKNSTGTEYINIKSESYQLIELLGKPALFSNSRITPKDIPQGLYCYDLRHSDDGNHFCSVEPKVIVNHGGSIITKEPLTFGEEGFLALSEETEPNFSGQVLTISDFMRNEIEQEQSLGECSVSINTVTADDLRRMNGREGLILQNCGGNPQEWLDGINGMLTEDGILQEGTKFHDCSAFEHDGLTCLFFPFSEDVKLDVGKLAILCSHKQLGGTWLSDYVPNHLGGFIEETVPEREKPDCKLLGEDGNIFNLMGLAARILRQNVLAEQAPEMTERITGCGSYDEALTIPYEICVSSKNYGG